MTGSSKTGRTVVAVRRPLDVGPPIDPFEVAGPTGIVFQSADRIMVGLGAALTFPLPRGLEDPVAVRGVTDQMAAIECDDEGDESTSGIVALGTLPFDRSAPGALVLPEVLYCLESDGTAWVTVTGPEPGLPSGSMRDWLQARITHNPPTGSASGPHGRVLRSPAPPVIVPRLSDTAFEAMVSDVVRAIDAGDVDKVVLARQVDVRMGQAIDVTSLLRRWHRLEPSCSVFSMPTPDGQLVGASPELLVRRVGDRVNSRPLAGTTDRSDGAGGVLPRELMASAKDSAEHRMVVDAIGNALAPLCSVLEVPVHPDLVHLHSITHLGTSVSGTLLPGSDGRVPTALELVAGLHPTPAVGGVPRKRALELISNLEPEPRGHYAGPVGYVDARGDGSWMLGIRAVTIDGPDARLVAGVGVVEGSQPRTERVETVLEVHGGVRRPGSRRSLLDHRRPPFYRSRRLTARPHRRPRPGQAPRPTGGSCGPRRPRHRDRHGPRSDRPGAGRSGRPRGWPGPTSPPPGEEPPGPSDRPPQPRAR